MSVQAVANGNRRGTLSKSRRLESGLGRLGQTNFNALGAQVRYLNKQSQGGINDSQA